MRRKLTILLVGALVAVLAIGALAPAVSAHSGTDTDEQTPYTDAENATETRAQSIAYWMESRMGPEGVEAFEDQTGVSIDAFAQAMAEYMGPAAGNEAPRRDTGQFGTGSGYGYQAPYWGNGPRMPCGGWGGVGHSGGYGPWGGYGGGYGTGGYGSGMGGPGMMGGGW